ncbi:hypothetical protein PLESTB_000203900 [Pleodorina starrii]|uniref:Uncharacterized protein n=1 Tax=Pleodorina starrii TaxID=330485 RepID=A0A9W6BCV2_9CHLO|nr:hypothetical protein PLESTM_000327700 [Pleodorina starrii]GLC49297.1 hypothetical protein PLESTB_000203900 [Pleodorina starrii]GLC73446.1 hypothetical protein PLESTF_001376500 [Pleodorina starrii]
MAYPKSLNIGVGNGWARNSYRSSTIARQTFYVTADPPRTCPAARRPGRPLRASNGDSSSSTGCSNPGDEDDELDRLLGIGRYRDDSTGFFSARNRGNNSSGSDSEAKSSGAEGQAGSGTGEVQDTLADIMQMEVRRVRAKEELMTDLEDRKERMRAIGEEMKAALARDYELNRMRTEIGANFAMSEAFHALDDVEADIARIKKQLQADKADLEAWEAQAAEDRSRGLFFKSLYSVEKEPRQPVGKSIPGYWRKQRAAAAAAAAEAAAAATGSPAADTSTDWENAEAVVSAAERPLSAASRQVRSPLRLYLFSYLSAFLALVLVNDVASAAGPHVAQDVLYGILSAGLGFVAVQERQALGQAQVGGLVEHEAPWAAMCSQRSQPLCTGGDAGGHTPYCWVEETRGAAEERRRAVVTSG